MMIRSQNFTAPAQNVKSAAPAAAAKEVATQSNVPSESADINFNAKPSKLESMLAATAVEAAELKGTLDNHEPGELIIRTKPGFSLGKSDSSVVDDLGATVLSQFDTPGGLSKSDGGEFLHLKLPAGVSVEEAMAAMAKDGRVEFAVPNHTYGLPELPESGKGQEGVSKGGISNDPDVGKLWGLDNQGQTGGKVNADIDAPQAWGVHSGRNQADGGPIVAIIDTGISYDHPDLAANMWSNPGEIAGDGIDNDGNGIIDDIHGYNAFDNSGDPRDKHGHGSHCAGTIGAVGDDGVGITGVNKHANMMAIKIFSDAGSTNAAAIIRGIQYATKMGARITSNSWGGGGANAGIEQAFKDSPAFHIMAAGNSGTDNDRRPNYPSNYDLPNKLAVAATDHKDGLAKFSQFGKKTVEIGAPGVDIYSTVPGGYDTYSGTSMATPHVAGAATLLVSAYPELSNAQLKEALLGGVDQIPSLDGKTSTGGRLNVDKSLELARELIAQGNIA